MDILLFNIFNNYSECLFCGNVLVRKNTAIKFCDACCGNILEINGKLKQLLDTPFFLTEENNISVLEKRLGIKSRKDFKEWAKKNHPDKGGHPEIFRKVSQLVDKRYPRI